MEKLFIPVLHSFENNNVFSGSCGIKGQLWHGPYCLEKSEVEKERVFPMSEQGRENILEWLEENL